MEISSFTDIAGPVGLWNGLFPISRCNLWHNIAVSYRWMYMALKSLKTFTADPSESMNAIFET